MQLLVLNPGSSSLRFQVVELRRADADWDVRRLGGGGIADIGGRPTARARVAGADPECRPVRAERHVEALDEALAWTRAHGLDFEAAAVRVVHGGGSRDAAAPVDAALLARLSAWSEAAPLHDRPSLQVLERLRARVGDALPLYAAFDSAFHADLPEVARTYAIPRDLALRHGIRRFGFHGFAVASVARKLVPRPARLVALHLGSGASVTAVRDGRSVDTSMGFTPLEGLAMATRSGDLDPALVPWLARLERRTPQAIVELLNRESGLLGISGASSDMREIERLRAAGHPGATLAFDVFAHRARRHVAAAMASLGGADALAFSGGIGEHSAAVRAAILAGLEWAGLELDGPRNAAATPGSTISRAGSRLLVHVVGVDEEAEIARAAARCARGSSGD